MATIKKSYSIGEAAKITLLSTRMLDYLCRMKIVIPTASRKRGRGYERMFSFGDLLQLRTIHDLLKSGISVTRLKDSLKRARRGYKAINENTPLIKRYFIIHDDTAYFISDDVILDLFKNPDQFAFSFVIDVETTRKTVRNEIEKLPVLRTASRSPKRQSTRPAPAAPH
tara:strand:+ start:529 stop:1035 length:507 start_codon:yes stop_codon:yes gene_type:complete